MKKLFVFLVFTLLIACSQPPGWLTPEEAVRERVLQTDPGALNIQLLGLRSTPEGKWVLIYTYFLPPQADFPGMFNLGYGTYARTNDGRWQSSGSGGGSGSSVPPNADQLIDYFTSRGSITAIIGQVLSPSIAYVEAVLSTGETVRDRGGDRAFAIFAPQDVQICELRLVGFDGELLRRDPLAPSEAIGSCP
jgi:hypothetical protein